MTVVKNTIDLVTPKIGLGVRYDIGGAALL